jgi:TetR/AcrR family transcriptional repressor of nem operon
MVADVARPKAFDRDVALDKAMRSFWRTGFAATTAQDLVDSMGLGRGSLYNAFVSKEQLFHAALRRYDETQASGQEDLLAQEGSIHERIRMLLMTVVDEETSQSGPRGCLAVNAAVELADRNPEVRELVRAVFERMENALRDAIDAAQRAGEIAADDSPRELARYVLNAMYGLRVLGKTATRQALVGIVEITLRAL